MDSETAVKAVRDNAKMFFIMLLAFLALVALAAYLLGMRAGAKEARTEMLQLLQPQYVCSGADDDCQGYADDEFDRELIIVPDSSGSMAPLLEELFRGPPQPVRLPPGVLEI